jgi:AraC-like DNA-binding protein
MRQLRPGLVLRCSASRHAHGGRSHPGAANAGLHLVVVLQGRVQVAYDAQPLALGEGSRENVALTALSEPVSFARLDQGMGAERKLALEMSPEWLRQSELLRPRRHLQPRRWQAGQRVQQLAAGLLGAAAAAPDGLERLRQECLTLELLGEVLGLEQAQGPEPISHQMQRARELLDSGAADRWSLADIALELGLHENTLQRRFRAAQGCSVFDYLRACRLERARTLLRGGASVTQAALEAGYDNPANFATAFKRHFGLAPSRMARADAARGAPPGC